MDTYTQFPSNPPCIVCLYTNNHMGEVHTEVIYMYGSASVRFIYKRQDDRTQTGLSKEIWAKNRLIF